MNIKEYIARLGIGSAHIDLILEKETYRAGEQVDGYFLIKGGAKLQQLKRIDCDFVLKDRKEKHEEVVDFVTILTTECIHAKDSNKIPFAFQLPEVVKPSSDIVSYRFKTRLAFKKGEVIQHEDAIQIVGE